MAPTRDSTNGSRLVLPRPARRRYQPLRAGILNVWEYDDQEFWFHDGCLILRGANEAGKSKALELLLPFLLDADIRPQRLDPFGERSKDMLWNLIEFDPDRTSAIGYCWIEFGRLDEDGGSSFLTLGAGLRGSRGAAKVKPWYFVTRKRVRADLFLIEGRTPLAQERLEQAVGKECVYSEPRDYRIAVDRELFGLGVDRYTALIHLLLQLRRPHLSDSLDPDKLSDVLAESLPPLEQERIAQLASAFDRLDAEADSLDNLEKARDSVLAFRDEYRGYARILARRRAAEVRGAATKFDNVTRRVREATDAVSGAQKKIEVLAAEQTERKNAEAKLDATKKILEASEEMQAAHRLIEVKQNARAARDTADRLAAQAKETLDDLDTAKKERRDLEERVRSAEEHRHDRQAAGSRAAAAAGIGTLHEAHGEEMRTRPRAARKALDAAADGKLDAIKKLRGHQKKVHDETTRAAECQRKIDDDLLPRREAAETKVRDLARRREDEEAALAVAIRDWVTGLSGVTTSSEDTESLVEQSLALVAVSEPCGSACHKFLAPHLKALERELSALAVARSRIETQRRDLADQKAMIESERDDGPPLRPGRAADRSERSGGAFWQLCDFAASLDETGRAAIEASLEAAGLLDAWVTPDGRVLDVATLETVLTAVAAPAAVLTLADVLVPTPSDQVDEQTIRAVLRQIAVVEIGDGPDPVELDVAWIALDGRWRLGPLRGRWIKTEAEYIGAATRAATRARKLAYIAEKFERLAEEFASLVEREHATTLRQKSLGAAAARFPSGSQVLTTTATLGAAREAAKEARDALEKAQRELVKVRQRVDQATAALTRAAAEVDLLDAIDNLDARVEALHDYKGILGDLAAACERFLVAVDGRDRVATRVDGLEQRSDRQRQETLEAERKAQVRAAEAETLEQRVGASAADVLARLDRVVTELVRVRERLERIAGESAEANKTLARAEAELGNANTERELRERERGWAIEQFASLARTELLGLAAPEPAAGIESPPWNVTAALDLARRIEKQLSEIGMDEKAKNEAANRTFQGFTTLRTALGGDFDPAVSQDGDVLLVNIKFNGRVHGVSDLVDLLREEVVKRQELFDREERALIEQHLLGDVGLHLQERMNTARRLVDAMNAQLAEHPTNSKVVVRLDWRPLDDAADVAAALKVMQKDVRLLVETDQEALVRFLRARITDARKSEGVGSSADRMARALDYRRWHRFAILMVQDGHQRVMTKKAHRTGSGGSKAVLVHLPLFAAASAHYRSAKPEAPHLIMLDEAFDGVDRGQRGSCMGLLVQFDLDFVITNYEEWGCYEELPGVATYHLSREPGKLGVAALRFVWDGRTRQEDDPFLVTQQSELT